MVFYHYELIPDLIIEYPKLPEDLSGETFSLGGFDDDDVVVLLMLLIISLYQMHQEHNNLFLSDRLVL